MNPIPPWLRDYLKENDLEKIRQLIGKIEQRTEAELVPLIVRSSLDLKLIRAFFLASSIALTLMIGPLIHSLIGWQSALLIDLLYGVIGFALALLAWWAASSSQVIRKLYNKKYLEALVFRRACGEFFENQLQHTQSRTAVLFMYSVLERKAMIIADPNLREFPSKIWEEAIAKMIEAARKKDFSLGFYEAFELCAKELGQLYPPQAINKNEFEDNVLIKE